MDLCYGSDRPEDLRDEGLMVAVHNDYMLDGVRMTFWLMTKGCGACMRAFKGEGRTDVQALDQIRDLFARK